MDNKKVGSKINELRKAQGMTQQQLSERLSVTNKAISKWETGGELPDIAILPALAQALDTSIDELLRDSAGDSDKPPAVKPLYLLLAAVVQFVLAVLLFFIMYRPEWGFLRSFWHFYSFICVLAIGFAAAFIVKTIRKIKNLTVCLVLWGFPIAGVIMSAINAIMTLPDNPLAVSYPVILVPLLYTALFSVVTFLFTRALSKNKNVKEGKNGNA
jgi:transcriptional regulator with XRE-family HTH domain